MLTEAPDAAPSQLTPEQQFERAVVLHNTSVTDIENVKNRRVSISNYAVLIIAGLIGAAKLFADDKAIAANTFALIFLFVVLYAALVCSVIFPTVIQAGLLRAIRISRDRLYKANETLEIDIETTDQKMKNDRPMIVCLIAAPMVAAMLAGSYFYFKVTVALDPPVTATEGPVPDAAAAERL